MTVMTISCLSTDCWGSGVYGLVTGGTTGYLGGTNNFNEDVRNWIPFTITLPHGLIIQSAVIRFVAASSRSESLNVQLACEAADFLPAPANLADLFGRTLTSAKSTESFGAWTSGVEYSYDITGSVQEILNRAGFAYGGSLAVIIDNNGHQTDHRREIVMSEHATLVEPLLNITFAPFVPRGSGLI